ncbi:uncharacterized protein G2W53_004621 [Senna tora]|uniref:Retrotransposon gag domain-containing protein n=1 Tax=Senna tora TaxID=362788 RepID=A0A834XFJ9_9FABA|nr:uncharacterized protein G2W53_004621 [Senna tora]
MLQPHDGPDLPLPGVGVCLSAPHYSSCYDMYSPSHSVRGIRAESGPEGPGGLLSPLPSVSIFSPVFPPIAFASTPGRLGFLLLGLPPSLACCTSSNAMYMVDLASSSAMVFGGFLVMELQNNLLRRLSVREPELRVPIQSRWKGSAHNLAGRPCVQHHCFKGIHVRNRWTAKKSWIPLIWIPTNSYPISHPFYAAYWTCSSESRICVNPASSSCPPVLPCLPSSYASPGFPPELAFAAQAGLSSRRSLDPGVGSPNLAPKYLLSQLLAPSPAQLFVPSMLPIGRWTEGGAAGGPSGDRTTALLEALTARRAAQEKAREAGAGGTPEQGSVNLPPDPRDDVMIALLEQQKLLQEEIQEMRKKMGSKEGQGDNSKKQDLHKSGSRKSRSIKRRRREEESDRSSSESRSGESSSSSQSTDFTPPKKKKRYPFVDRIMDVVMPKLRTPTQLKHYDGASDPIAHVKSFKAAMLYAGAPDEVMCRAFPSTLDGDTQLRFSDLPSGSIFSFKQLSKRFTSYFATSRTIKRTAHCLKNVVQGKEESLKDFLIRFTKAARQIQGLKMEVALSYLTGNLRSKLFCCSITKKPPKTMAELLARSTKYIAFEEVQQAKEGGNPRRRKPSLLGAEAKPIGGKIGEKIGGMIGIEGSGDRGPLGRSGPDSARAGDRRNQRRDDRSHRGGDQRHREDNTDTVAGTIHVIAGGVVRGTEADPHTRKRQISKTSANAGDLEGAESPSRVMNAELVDPREREEERRPNPEGEMEAVALTEKDPTRTTKVGADLDPSLRKEVFQKVVIERIPREENERADSLSKLSSASARCGANPILKARGAAPGRRVPQEGPEADPSLLPGRGRVV